MLKVTNTLGGKEEEFKPINPSEVTFYQCGPTVYWNQHIGNMRAVVIADLIRRSIEYLGFPVKFVRNYTDFGHMTSDADEGEDKMEKAAKRESLSPRAIADKYIEQYEKDVKALNTLAPTVRARATDYLDQMIKMVQELMQKGYAYATPKAIYYDISKFEHYYDLSGHVAEKEQEGAGHGTVSDPNKKQPADFALWFFKTGDHKNALQFWPSPFTSPEVENGYGFPGWHIECSAMASTVLGVTLDFHMGGIEHIPVHHTNEIAQSEAISGKKFVNYWLHNGHLMLNGKKIAKSDGNFFTLEQLEEKGYDPMHLRYLFLQTSYRMQQNFTWEAMDAARTAYVKLINIYARNSSQTDNQGEIIAKAKEKFTAAIEDDFNFPQALAVLWDLVKSDAKAYDINSTIDDFDRILGLEIEKHVNLISATPNGLTAEISDLVDKRKQARTNKDWQKADEIRQLLKTQYKYNVQDESTK